MSQGCGRPARCSCTQQEKIEYRMRPEPPLYRKQPFSICNAGKGMYCTVFSALESSLLKPTQVQCRTELTVQTWMSGGSKFFMRSVPHFLRTLSTTCTTFGSPERAYSYLPGRSKQHWPGTLLEPTFGGGYGSVRSVAPCHTIQHCQTGAAGDL